MASTSEFRKPMRIRIIHPDLGIGGAERLVVDAALGLQRLGHTVDIVTSHHDPNHAFEETKNGTLTVFSVPTPIPRSLFGAFHIYLAILRQLFLLLAELIRPSSQPDVYVVDQLSACIPLLRWFTTRRVVFYCHFPDKLLASGKEAVLDGKPKLGLLKWLYRAPADWVEERSTGSADVLLANSQFTANVFRRSFPSITKRPEVVYPGINIEAYDSRPNTESEDILPIASSRPTFISLNRFERKKNTALAIDAFALLLRRSNDQGARLVVGGGYDPRLRDNIDTLIHLTKYCERQQLTYCVIPNKTSPAPTLTGSTGSAEDSDVVFILNFTTAQRQYLLHSPTTLCLLYTPGNEHFGIGPVEGMACGLPVVACTSGGPTESLVDYASHSLEGNSKRPIRVQGTAWLRDPNPEEWERALEEVLKLSESERQALSDRAKERAKQKFSMEEMCKGFERALVQAIDMGPATEHVISWKATRIFLISFIFALLCSWRLQ